MKLSVCIPVYKVEQYIERCARSLFGQTLKDMEFVFVDDCSPDGSLDVLRRVLADYPERQPQVKIVRHERNAGLIRARKTALAAATGEWIVHCDSDDWVDADLYAKMVACAEAQDADMVFCPMVRNEDEPMNVLREREFDGDARAYFASCDRLIAFFSTVNKMYRRSIACADDLELPDGISVGEDVCRTTQSVARCRRIVAVTGTRYHYRENAASITGSFDPRKMLDDLESVYEVLIRRVDEDMARPVHVASAINIVFYGLKFGVFDAAEYGRWWKELRRVSKGNWACGLPFKRRNILRLAGLNYAVGRFMIRWFPNTKVGAL